MKIIDRYNLNKGSKVNETCICPSCGTSFIKTSYQQCFCKSKPKTQCKDKYWNTVTPQKRNNTTRISPASASWLDQKNEIPQDREIFGVWHDDDWHEHDGGSGEIQY